MLLGGFNSSVTQATVSAYTDAVRAYSTEAVRAAYEDYRDQKVAGHDYRFPPTAPLFAGRARMHQNIFDRAAGVSDGIKLYNGMLDMDFGNGRVDLRGLTAAEQDVIIANGGRLNGKNAALLTLDQKRAEIARSLPAPVAA